MVENPPAMQETWVGKILKRRKWLLTPVFLPEESHEQRSLVRLMFYRYRIIIYIPIELGNPYGQGASLVVQMVKSLPTMQETRLQSLAWEDPLEKEMANHSIILAWRSP